jgi:hypothetical protein
VSRADAGRIDAPPPPKRGTTLQSTILPGAAEFGEHILEPALKAVAEQVRKNHADSSACSRPTRRRRTRCAPPASCARTSPPARSAAARAQMSLRAVEKLMDGWSHDAVDGVLGRDGGRAAGDTLDPTRARSPSCIASILDA